MVGYLAYSIAGRDKNNVYIVFKEEPDYVWLVDGKNRKINNPKRKNKKHIQIIKKNNPQTCSELITDEKIKYVIDRVYYKGIQEVK